jgi:hypothetical protein
MTVADQELQRIIKHQTVYVGSMAVIIAILVLIWLVFFFPIRAAVEFFVHTLITIINFLLSLLPL